MSRQEFPTKVRDQAIQRADGHCQKCGAALKPGEAEVDHILPCALGGASDLANAMVLCRPCHAEKTAGDIGRIRKADRQRRVFNGAKKPTGKLKGPSFAQSDATTEKRAKRIKLSLPPRQLYKEKS